jgi:hypothetical protein
MCKAFSGIVEPSAKVTWKLGMDDHTSIIKLAGFNDNGTGELFSKFEITPKNGNYLEPDEWVFRWDESPVPKWADQKCKEAALAAHKKWLKQLDKFIIRHPIVNPFKLTPPATINKTHFALLKKWASVRASVGGSVGGSVWDSVRDSVRDSVGASVGGSVRASVGDSVWDSVGASVGASVRDSVRASVRASVWAYVGSFFRIPVWKYVKHPKGKYPYQPLVTLWNKGIVPSFDGTTWRLHGGPEAEILFSITDKDLKK